MGIREKESVGVLIMLTGYRKGHSCIHTLDPRTKLLATAGTGLLIYLAGPPGLRLLSAAVLALARAAGIPLFGLLARLRPMLIFFVAIFMAHLLAEGDIYTGMIAVVRFALLILFATIMTHTTSPSELNMALAYFLRPLGRHGTDIAFMVRVAMAFMPGLLRDKETILRAQAARGYKPNGLTGFTVVMVPLLRRSFRKADELANALESRCYHQDREYYYYSKALTGRDQVLIGIFVVVLVLSLASLVSCL
ncbi:MAG TPA: energy-coupling factor transporter transmembrane protein EcfT [Methanosarcinales archaeon]|nr:energy-coupling factor transporter transmembrane protein EcfT [Methanosarcinales archaeon]